MEMRKGRQRSGGRTSMLRFLSRFRGSRAMLHSSTSSGGVTEFSVYKGLLSAAAMGGDGAPEITGWLGSCPLHWLSLRQETGAKPALPL